MLREAGAVINYLDELSHCAESGPVTLDKFHCKAKGKLIY